MQYRRWVRGLMRHLTVKHPKTKGRLKNEGCGATVGVEVVRLRTRRHDWRHWQGMLKKPQQGAKAAGGFLIQTQHTSGSILWCCDMLGLSLKQVRENLPTAV